MKLVVKFWHDDQVESPCDEDGWKVYSFSPRHANYKHPDEFHDDESLDRKRREGFAFPLSYFEHGQCLWTLSDELPPGANCPFDSVGLAGFIVWEQDESNLGPDTFETRQADARAFIERYTLWCNGEIYGYTIDAVKDCEACGKEEEVEAEFDLPSCGGYYADDIAYMVESMKEHIGDDWADYEMRFEEQYPYGLADTIRQRWKEEG